MEPHIRAMDKAKIRLMDRRDSTFFTTVFFSLKLSWDAGIRTAATDGVTIRFSPEFFMQQNPEQQLGLILHETLHAAYLHMIRRGDRDPKKWNIAADHMINLQLTQRGFQIPEGGYCDKQYLGMSADQIYDLLPEPEYDDFECDLVDSPATLEKPEEVMTDILIRAAIQSQMAEDKPGSIPHDLEIFLNKILNPKLPWYTILRKFFNSMGKTDYSFRKPNRRFFPDYILPGLYSEAMGEMAIAVDSSGSVSDADFNVFVSETHGILKNLHPSKIHFMCFDTEIKTVNTVTSTKDLSQVKFTGRGGTRIDPVMEWANEEKPKVILVFTDGYFTKPAVKPSCPVIWLIYNNPKFTAPFGRVIHFELDT